MVMEKILNGRKTIYLNDFCTLSQKCCILPDKLSVPSQNFCIPPRNCKTIKDFVSECKVSLTLLFCSIRVFNKINMDHSGDCRRINNTTVLTYTIPDTEQKELEA